MKIIHLKINRWFGLALVTSLSFSTPQSRSSDMILVSQKCVKTAEHAMGAKRICYYNCGGTSSEITVKASQACPPTIQR